MSECIYVDSMGGATGLVENILCRDLPDSKSDPWWKVVSYLNTWLENGFLSNKVGLTGCCMNVKLVAFENL